MLDGDVEWFTRTDRFLVGASFDPRQVVVFDRKGNLHHRHSLGSGVQVAGRYAYVILGNEYRRHRVRVVALKTGRALRTVSVPGWFYPFNPAHPENCWC
jgi:hypothetical protein